MSINFLSSYTFKNKLKTNNRVALAPMASKTADDQGHVTAATIKHYQKLIKANTGICFVEYCFVSEDGKSDFNQLGVNKEDKIEGIKKINTLIKSNKSTSIIQLAHGGGKCNPSLEKENKILSPSGIVVPSPTIKYPNSQACTIANINQIKIDFLNSAHIAYRAGFDGVELHMAHGYGLNQWLSPITNKRNDQYGGSITGRCKIANEIIKSIKLQYPKKILSARLPGQDFLAGGLTNTEIIKIAKLFEECGLDILNISSGIGTWTRPDKRIGEGFFTPEAIEIKKQVNIPIITVGGITSTDFINNGLANYHFDFAAIGRDILNDPSKWKKKLKN